MIDRKNKNNHKYIDMNIYYLTPKLEGLLYSQKVKDCLKDGLFCQRNTNLNINKEITGIDLIYESLYHQCLFQRGKKIYFNLLSQYDEMCLNSEKFSNFCAHIMFQEYQRRDSFGNNGWVFCFFIAYVFCLHR